MGKDVGVGVRYRPYEWWPGNYIRVQSIGQSDDSVADRVEVGEERVRLGRGKEQAQHAQHGGEAIQSSGVRRKVTGGRRTGTSRQGTS